MPPSSLETSFCIITISFCALYFNRIENKVFLLNNKVYIGFQKVKVHISNRIIR